MKFKTNPTNSYNVLEDFKFEKKKKNNLHSQDKLIGINQWIFVECHQSSS